MILVYRDGVRTDFWPAPSLYLGARKRALEQASRFEPTRSVSFEDAGSWIDRVLDLVACLRSGATPQLDGLPGDVHHSVRWCLDNPWFAASSGARVLIPNGADWQTAFCTGVIPSLARSAEIHLGLDLDDLEALEEDDSWPEVLVIDSSQIDRLLDALGRIEVNGAQCLKHIIISVSEAVSEESHKLLVQASSPAHITFIRIHDAQPRS